MNPRRRLKIENAASTRIVDVCIVIENVQDVRNLGAVLRSCEATGIYNIVVLMSDPTLATPELVLGKRSSMGARQWVKVHYFNDRTKCFQFLRSQFTTILASLPGEESADLYDLHFDHPTALIFGNESTGISEETILECDGSFHIPMTGLSESLNLSIACAVTVYEVFRQRRSIQSNSPEISKKRELILLEYLDNAQRKNRIRHVKPT